MDHYPSLQTRPSPSPGPAHWARSPNVSHTAETDRHSHHNHSPHHRHQPPPGQHRHQHQQYQHQQYQQQQPHFPGSPQQQQQQQFYRQQQQQQHPYHRQPHPSPAPPPLPSSSSASSSVHHPPSSPQSSSYPSNALPHPKAHHAHAHADKDPWDQNVIADRMDIDHTSDLTSEPWRSEPASSSPSKSMASYSAAATATIATAQSDPSSASKAAPGLINSPTNGHFALPRADAGPYTHSYPRYNHDPHRPSLARPDDALKGGLDNRGEGAKAVATRDVTGVRSGTGANTSTSTGAGLRAPQSGMQIGAGTSSLGDAGAIPTSAGARTWAAPPAELPILPEEGLAVLSSIAQLHPFRPSDKDRACYQDQDQGHDPRYDQKVQGRRQGPWSSIEKSGLDYQLHEDRPQARGYRPNSPTSNEMAYDQHSRQNHEEWSQKSQSYCHNSPPRRRSSSGQHSLEHVPLKGSDDNRVDFRSRQQQYQQEQQQQEHRPQYFHHRSQTPTQHRPLDEPIRVHTPIESPHHMSRRTSYSQQLVKKKSAHTMADSGASTQDSSYDSSPEVDDRKMQDQDMELYDGVSRSAMHERFKFGTDMPNTVDLKAAIESCDALCKFALHYANQSAGEALHQQQSRQDHAILDRRGSENGVWKEEEASSEPILDPNEFANLQMIRNMNTSMLIGLQKEGKDTEQGPDSKSEQRLQFGEGPPTHEMVHELAKAATSIFQLAIRIKSWVNMTPEQRKLDEEITIIRGKRCLMMDGALSVPTLDRHGNIQKDWAIVPASSSVSKTFHERQREMEQRQSQPIIPVQSVPQQSKGKSIDSVTKGHREASQMQHLSNGHLHGDNNPQDEKRGFNPGSEHQEGRHRGSQPSNSGAAPKAQGKGKGKDTQAGKNQTGKPKDESHQKYRKRAKRTQPPGRCLSCDSSDTPEWRRGPDGARTLCNACGLHYAKLLKRQGEHARLEYPFLPGAGSSSNSSRSPSSHMGQLQAIRFPLRRPQTSSTTAGGSGSSASGSTEGSVDRDGSRSESAPFASPGAAAETETQARSPTQEVGQNARSSMSISTQGLPPHTVQAPISPNSEEDPAFKDSSDMKSEP
ncbi:hypothetical protein EMPS_06706 [Entomortierella parvispora]|uniref:GATA-type domain-containing protein n=1 Tax=Entomortierella parvispora TaxID=205924 RepID=A0A9P3LXQ5_9FUNG|nr:hypothetical protein EMPS_06706 [Entomortierella parvispora]